MPIWWYKLPGGMNDIGDECLGYTYDCEYQDCLYESISKYLVCPPYDSRAEYLVCPPYDSRAEYIANQKRSAKNVQEVHRAEYIANQKRFANYICFSNRKTKMVSKN